MRIVRETSIPDQGTQQRYDVLKEMGDCYCSVGDFENARKYYEQASWLEPDEAGPYVGTGVIELQNGNEYDAEVAFRVALRLDPSCAKAHSGLAMIAQQRQQWPAAFDHYLKSLELDSNDLTALLGLFQISCQIGSFEKVIHYLQVFLKIHPEDCSVLFCLAALYTREGKHNRARDVLRDLLMIDPNHTDAQNLLEEVEHKLAHTNQE